MNRLYTLAAVAGAVLILASSLSFAEMADGSYYHDFSGEVPLWDISGSYTDSDIGLGFSSMDFTLSEDPSGALTGAGTFSYDDGDVVLNGPATITGKVKSSGTVVRVSMKVLISGTGTVDTDPVLFTATITANSELDGAAGELVLTSGHANAKLMDIMTGRKGSDSGRLDPGSTMDLPLDSTGDWNLTLNLVPDGTKYTGTAVVGTSTGGTADLTATGSYASKTDTSKITLKRTGGNLKLLISTVGSNMTVDSVKGKLYGQSVKFPQTAIPVP